MQQPTELLSPAGPVDLIAANGMLGFGSSVQTPVCACSKAPVISAHLR
jgi:hypothetical protein